MKYAFLVPFQSKDFRLLYIINVCEFFATTLSRLAALQWLYEATGDGRILGGLGVVTLTCQIPSIALGGVLADTVTRTHLVSNVQAVSTFVAFLRFVLCLADSLSVHLIYLTVGLLEITTRLESSARSSIVTSVVPAHALPHAVTLEKITQYLGEILAPFIFWALADVGSSSLTPPFAAAALSFLPCALLPRFIRANTTPGEALGMSKSSSSSDGNDEPSVAGRWRGCGAPMTAVSRSWFQGLARMVEGIRYIAGHPLLPGLYALDWGFTCVSFYRELFPMWVGTWLTSGVPPGLSSRGAVALLVIANFTGGLCGSTFTLALNTYPYKGRLVVYATAGYGVACFAFGCSRQLLFGAAMIFCLGACDAVGATMRKQVVLLTTPDHLRGRAQSGHQMAAYLANSLGQIYVAFMASAIGPGTTMQLGGGITEVMTALSALKIPTLLTHKGGDDANADGSSGDDGAAANRGAGMRRGHGHGPQASVELAVSAVPLPSGDELAAVADDELNEAARAARAEAPERRLRNDQGEAKEAMVNAGI